MKVVFFFGTRPEAIKLAPLIKALKGSPGMFEPVSCAVAQHRHLLDHVLHLFAIKPDYDLNIMEADQSLFDISAKGLLAIREVLQREMPDLVVVQGDTTSTFIASLASFYLQIPVGHVEAGLRTLDKYRPFPEEINRRLTTHIADLHFAPTERAQQNLLAEGIREDSIFVTGNTVIDALLLITDTLKSPEKQKALDLYFNNQWGIHLSDTKKNILVTGHRRESFGEQLEHICLALKHIAQHEDDVQIIYPVHLNPNVQRQVKKILQGVKNIHLIEPLEYDAFVYLMNRSYVILTDSGGIQEEAPSLGRPVLVMRQETERPEGVEAGVSKVVGTDKESIVREMGVLLHKRHEYEKMSKTFNPYGDGKASERIIEAIRHYFKMS
jgi:UDP-N-acetylglucosamine 2-epimerase (non-hydrolysing)